MMTTDDLRVGDVVTLLEFGAAHGYIIKAINESAGCWVLTLAFEHSRGKIQYHMRPWKGASLDDVCWIANVKRRAQVVYARQVQA
jgi:hypothetical protein